MSGQLIAEIIGGGVGIGALILLDKFYWRRGHRR